MNSILTNSSAIVLAAGKGTRMGTKIPKVLRKVNRKYLVQYILETLKKLELNQVIVVVGHQAELVKTRLGNKHFYAHQETPLGTADAVKSGIKYLDNTSKYILVINGDDSSLLTAKTLFQIFQNHIESQKNLTMVTSTQKNVSHLFGILKNEQNEFVGFDRNSSQNIKEIATGIYIFNKDWLKKHIELIKQSDKGSFNLPEIVKFALLQKTANCFILGNSEEWRSANTPQELNRVRRIMKRRKNI